MKSINFLLFVVFVASTNAITTRDLYESSGPGSVTLTPADDESAKIQLQSPVHFCTEKFDEVYINTNGILTFMSEFPEFLNIQFPIEYPSISPFYSNVDITLGDGSTRITYYQTSSDSGLLSRASSTIRGAFADSSRFQATSVLVATWNNVPKWRGANNRRERSYEKNSYQVAIISNNDESYVELLYPQGGIQWVQAETGESGLPDIRARAGFILTDGRIVELRGSGTDKVRHLTETSNYGKPGRWLYRIGKLNDGENIKEPDVTPARVEEVNPTSCASGGRFQCHSAANCQDNANGHGFCCKCKDGYYGNGYSCLKSGVPVRVTGSVHGHIGKSQVQSQIQSYIVTSDGKSYTAMSSIGSADIGTKMQILEIIGGAIGWVFAKPVGTLYNGYQITGGKFNHTSNIRFDSGENIHITQRFVGLNAWDQLAVEIEISGDVPDIHEGIKLTMEDFFEEFTASGSSITGVTNHRVQLSSGDPDITYTIYQNINFEPCEFSDQNQLVNFINGRMKTSKINLAYHSNEGAVRISTLSKIGVTDKTNPCIDGTANCGENTICIATSDDTYECECKNGFAHASDDVCADIDECRGSHICSEYAECVNRIGGYDCHCLQGYEGNGFECLRSSIINDLYQGTTRLPPYFVPVVSRCGECSENAYCHNDVCICNSGFLGNGHDCQMICALDEYFNGVNCLKLSTTQEDEVQPFCNNQADCTCPHGYQLIEYAHTSVCRIEENPDEGTQQQSCDIVNNCHRYANCELEQSSYRYECVCGPGYDGNGYDCIETEANCAQEDICDIHANCIYNSTLRKSFCVCQEGYEGSGKTCQAITECRSDSECGYHSLCNQGICECTSGYERDNSDICVPAGSCNGVFCAENGFCRFDQHRRINFCVCPDGYEGDGINECKFIPPSCDVRNNCGLYASCVPNYITSKYECSCNDGYIGDGLVCVPDMNCNNNPQLCDVNAECLPTAAGYKCICNQGFTGNGTVCKEPPKLEVGFLIISQGVAAVKIPLSGSKRGFPVSTASMAIGVDKDCAEGRAYWSDISAKAILSAKYDGTDKKTFINTDIISPEGIAIDWVSRRLYWTDSGKDTIEVASLDNSTLRSVLINKGLVNPRGIALDPHSKKLFWSDWNRDDPKIESANLDGSERRILARSPQVKLPNSLAISLNSGEVCFADAGAGNQKIECIDTYTQQTRIIVGNLSYPFGLAITNEQFYWSDWTTKKIESITVDGVRNPGIPAPLFSSHKMYGMTAVTDRCPIYFSVCNVNNGDCPPNRICLINPMSPSGKTCKCVDHADCNINDIDTF